MTDDQIIHAILNGDTEMEKAFSYLFHNGALQKSMQGTLYKMGAKQQDIPDLIQERLMIFYRNVIIKKFKGDSIIRTYLVSICKYQWLSQQKKRSGVTYSHIDENTVEPIEEQTPEGILSQKEGLQQYDNVTALLRACIKKLDEGCQQALSMWSEGKSMKDIQQKLGYGEAQAAANKTHRCRKRLRKLIEADPRLMNFINLR